MQKFHVVTLGCKINQYESEAVAEAWRAGGMAETNSPAEAQVLLVNSCAVTSRAVSDLRTTVRRLRKGNPTARIVVTGCAAQVLREELSAMPEVDAVVPQESKAALLQGPAGPFELYTPPAAKPRIRSAPPYLSALCHWLVPPRAGCRQGAGWLFPPLHVLYCAAYTGP